MSTTAHPVDSSYHDCCHAIGRHAATCTTGNLSVGGAMMPAMTTTPASNPPLPAGADPGMLEDWEREGGYRLIWSRSISLPERLASEFDIRVAAIQRLDGSIVATGEDRPAVNYGAGEITARDARRLADALICAADIADTWMTSQMAAAVKR